jgi:hypothetical protein
VRITQQGGGIEPDRHSMLTARSTRSFLLNFGS